MRQGYAGSRYYRVQGDVHQASHRRLHRQPTVATGLRLLTHLAYSGVRMKGA